MGDGIDDTPRFALYAYSCITLQRPQACQPVQSAFRPKGLSQPTYMSVGWLDDWKGI